MTEIILREEAYCIVGAAMEVHRELGPGFLEAVYREALCIVLDEKEIPFEEEKQVKIKFKQQFLTKKYRIDLMCYDSIVVELKAHSDITREDTAQLINYLKITNCKVGLLINFGASSLQYKRLIL